MELQTLHPKYITDAKGEKTEVILPINEYNDLLEDLEDLIAVAQRRNEETISLEDVARNLGIDV